MVGPKLAPWPHFFMASFQKTDKGYRAQIKIKGIRESQCFRTMREAKAWADARTYEITKEAELPPKERVTLKQALERYQDEVSPTKRGSRWEQIRIEAMLRDPVFPTETLLGSLVPDQIAKWRDERLKVVKPGTVLREIGVLSAVFDTCIKEWNWIDQNPIKMIRKPSKPAHRDSLYTYSQIKAILKAAGYSPVGPVRMVSQAVATCFLVALRTGMRAGELTGLTWTLVYASHGHLPHTKTIKRDVPLTQKTLRLIYKMKGYDPILVFGMKSQSLDANFRKYRDRAGVEGMTFHDSRHYAATQMAKLIDVLTLCKVFGWTNTKQALTYYNPKASDIAKMLDAAAAPGRSQR